MKYPYISILTLMCSVHLTAQSNATSFVQEPMNTASTKKIPDKHRSINFGGVLQWDYELNQSSQSKHTNDRSDTALRRSRIYAKGHINNHLEFKTTIRFGESSKTNGDAVNGYIRYTGLGNLFNIVIGKQKESFGLERLTSSKTTPLLERSAITEYYTSQHKIGINIQGKGKSWTYGLGLFESNDKNNVSLKNTAITGRVTKALNIQEQLLVHLGAGFTSRKNYINNKNVTRYNIEFASIYNSVHVQSEYFHTSATKFAQSNDGYYVQLGYVFNGIRAYKNGTLKTLTPHSPSGAWEVVTRYESGFGKFSDVELGKIEGEQVSAGINYYLDQHLRLGFSYMTAKQHNTATKNKEYRARLQLLF